VALGQRDHVLRPRGGLAHELLHLRPGHERDVGAGVERRLVADRVRASAGDVHDVAGRDRDPAHLTAVRLDVEREHALVAAVDLGRGMAVHPRRAAARGDRHVTGHERPGTGVARHVQGDLVASDLQFHRTALQVGRLTV
jgi:hypothetical protein